MIAIKFVLLFALYFQTIFAGYFEENEKVEEEDTVIEPCNHTSGEECANDAPQGSSPWPQGVIPFRISTDFSSKDHELISAMMDKIKDVSCIQFKEVTTEATFIDIKRRTDNKPCQSFVGYKNNGARDFFLQEDCMSRNGILHELMHALGFRHEHLRIDRDRYITINMSNVVHDKQKMFEKRKFLEHVLAGIGYDVKSVLHYPHNVWAIDKSRPTMIAISGEKIQAKGLSEKDIMKLNRLYECDRTVMTRVSETHTSATTTSTQPPTSKSTRTSRYNTFATTLYNRLATANKRPRPDHIRQVEPVTTTGLDQTCRTIAVQGGGSNLCTTYVNCCKQNCNPSGSFNTKCQFSGVGFDNANTFCHCSMPIAQRIPNQPDDEYPGELETEPVGLHLDYGDDDDSDSTGLDQTCRSRALQAGGNNMCKTYVACCRTSCDPSGSMSTKCQYTGAVFDNTNTFCQCSRPIVNNAPYRHNAVQPDESRTFNHDTYNMQHSNTNTGSHDQTCQLRARQDGGSNICTSYVNCCRDRCASRAFTTKCRYNGVTFDNSGTFCRC